jgi:hypothetical protein
MTNSRSADPVPLVLLLLPLERLPLAVEGIALRLDDGVGTGGAEEDRRRNVCVWPSTPGGSSGADKWALSRAWTSLILGRSASVQGDTGQPLPEPLDRLLKAQAQRSHLLADLARWDTPDSDDPTLPALLPATSAVPSPLDLCSWDVLDPVG